MNARYRRPLWDLYIMEDFAYDMPTGFAKGNGIACNLILVFLTLDSPPVGWHRAPPETPPPADEYAS